MKCVCLFVLALDSCSGASPPYEDPELDLSKVQRGNQIRYILFPSSDLSRTSLPYNSPSHLVATQGGSIRAHVFEYENPKTELWYHISPSLRAYEVIPDDLFRPARNTLVAEGQLPQVKAWTEYTSALLDSVMYWTDSGWVTEGRLQALEKD